MRDTNCPGRILGQLAETERSQIASQLDQAGRVGTDPTANIVLFQLIELRQKEYEFGCN